MISVKLNGGKYSCPSCWDEMKVRHYIRIIKEWEDGTDIADRDYFKLANILMDGKFTDFEKSADNQVTLINLVGWVITEPFEFNKSLPKVLRLKDKNISIPEDPRDLSIGQNIHLRRDYIEKSQKLEENIAIATAIYLQPIIDNSLFKMKRAEAIAKEIEDLPITLIYPIGFFLLNRAMKFGMPPEKTLLPIKTNLKKTLKKMLQGWLRFTF